MGWDGGISTMGYSAGGSTREICSTQLIQASEPQKSSFQIKPPFSKYFLSCATSASDSKATPASSMVTNPQPNSASSPLLRTTKYSGSSSWSLPTAALVSSENL